jgi:hypothetical protein
MTQFEDAWRRYLPPSRNNVTTRIREPKAADLQWSQDAEVTAAEEAEIRSWSGM